MGNTKFRLSDMIPNSWFYKLKEMGGRAGGNGAATGRRMKKVKPYYQQQHYVSPSPPRTPPQKQTQNRDQTQQPVTPNRASYYISRRMELEANKPVMAMDAHVTFWEPPRISKRKPRRRQLKPVGSSPRMSNSSAVSSRCGCRARRKPAESGSETGSSSTDWSQPCCTCRVTTSPTDIIIDVTAAAAKKLSPVVTKPPNPETKPGDKQQSPAGDKKSPPKEAHKLKTRVKSPRVLTKRTKHRKSGARRTDTKCGALDGFAVVKSSSDPHRDFRESMVEMIVENNIRKSKDLEELLACYLSLNSAEYHSVIVKVFEQIWFDLN